MFQSRAPPARPHIGIHPSNAFETGDSWGEDDAWDSTSDSESPRQSSLAMSWNKPSTSSPRPVPKAKNSSSSTLAFSYTHLNAPNPGSYPPREQQNGWTIVNKRNTDQSQPDPDIQPEVDDTMILGEMDPEPSVQKPGSVRPDVAEIVKGLFTTFYRPS